MMPKVSVRPAAIKKRMMPSCSPFRICSINSKLALPASYTLRRIGMLELVLELAVLEIDVFLIRHDGFDGLGHEHAVFVLDDLTDVVVLDRKVVAVVGELAAIG